jgi:tetratricopeptide (TPR) repeat protein
MMVSTKSNLVVWQCAAVAVLVQFTCGGCGSFQGVIDDDTKAIKLDAKNAKLYIHRGTAYLGLKQYQKALEDYSKAIELDPKRAMVEVDPIVWAGFLVF